MVTLEKNGIKVTLKSEIQIAAYKKSGWNEIPVKTNKNKKTEE